MLLLQAEELTKKYGDFTALEALDLQVNAGEIFCLLGANGAGKSTTIHLFLGFIAPTKGRALIKGVEVRHHPTQAKKHLAYIPENLMLYPNLSGFENLQYFAALAGKTHKKAALGQFLEAAGLPPEAHARRVKAYSKGMRQKVGIAIALAKEAQVLLLDEPTSGLDPQASNEFSQHLRMLSQQGVAILMATHDLFRARQVGTHIGIMQQGQLQRTLRAQSLSFTELENLYLDTIQAQIQ